MAVPYPSTLNVNVPGVAGSIQKVTATLHNFTHTCPEDLAVPGRGPTGAKTILMSGVGGCPQDASEPLINLTFDQAATSDLADIPVSGYPSSIAYKPSEASPTGSLTSPAPGSPYPVDLNVFNTTPPNGTWSLFIEDQARGRRPGAGRLVAEHHGTGEYRQRGQAQAEQEERNRRGPSDRRRCRPAQSERQGREERFGLKVRCRRRPWHGEAQGQGQGQGGKDAQQLR